MMTRFGAGVPSQRFTKIREPKGHAAYRCASDPTLHRLRHLGANGAKIQEKGFKQTWIVARPESI
jgi:hypothetical protein